jgi:hypothetical protein
MLSPLFEDEKKLDDSGIVQVDGNVFYLPKYSPGQFYLPSPASSSASAGKPVKSFNPYVNTINSPASTFKSYQTSEDYEHEIDEKPKTMFKKIIPSYFIDPKRKDHLIPDVKKPMMFGKVFSGTGLLFIYLLLMIRSGLSIKFVKEHMIKNYTHYYPEELHLMLFICSVSEMLVYFPTFCATFAVRIKHYD